MGPVAGNSVSARGVPRNQPGGAPVSLLSEANTVVQTRNPNSVIAGGSGREKFPVALSTGVFLPDKRNDEIQGEADGPGRSPPRSTREARGPGPPSTPRPDWRAPRGPGPAPHLEPQAGPHPRPRRPSAPAAGSARSAAGPRAAGRRSPSCSPPARRAGGGAATIYIKGQPARPGPAPRSPAPKGGGAAREPSGGGHRAPANPRPRALQGRGLGPRECARGAAAPPPASPARTWSQNGAPRPVSRRLPEKEIVPGTRDGSGPPPRPDSTEEPVLPTNPAWSC